MMHFTMGEIKAVRMDSKRSRGRAGSSQGDASSISIADPGRKNIRLKSIYEQSLRTGKDKAKEKPNLQKIRTTSSGGSTDVSEAVTSNRDEIRTISPVLACRIAETPEK